ncbi:hypothetical protein TGME49_202050 [Toxoplasma gondii ME49]|uniref:Transmembrane protein n=1 Tax=Toxoplasma gondii (strain ATCC 50611 / Me49) TaxID=508771 RepID=S8F9E4_TOXGM|nr:hypothetical protein TGME49_202050 [Toxoplasma gondii ME49]EPT30263.1 hypothetical protein TGME49_202050 [Toxoplasma gondii ME49]|eukprot:XP_018637424.1 hypothetical protein TGME49_202050 [Toxoplasma gondii ME49]
MTPPLGPIRMGRSLTLGLVSSFLVGCCFGPEQVFDARVVRLPGANPAGSIGGFLSVAEASFTTGSSTTNVVDTKKNEEDEPADGEDKEIVVPLRSTKSRGSRTKTRTHKTSSRQNGILRHPAAAATIGLTMMLVGTAIGAGAMLALARQREEQKKAEDTRTAQAAKSLEPKKVVLTADKAAQQQAEGDRYLSQSWLCCPYSHFSPKPRRPSRRRISDKRTSSPTI